MRYIISGKNIDVTEGLKETIYDKIGKLEKYFRSKIQKLHVTLSVEKSRQKIEVTIPVKGSIIRAEQVSDDMYVSIDLGRGYYRDARCSKYKTKLANQLHAAVQRILQARLSWRKISWRMSRLRLFVTRTFRHETDGH